MDDDEPSLDLILPNETLEYSEEITFVEKKVLYDDTYEDTVAVKTFEATSNAIGYFSELIHGVF